MASGAKPQAGARSRAGLRLETARPAQQYHLQAAPAPPHFSGVVARAQLALRPASPQPDSLLQVSQSHWQQLGNLTLVQSSALALLHAPSASLAFCAATTQLPLPAKPQMLDAPHCEGGMALQWFHRFPCRRRQAGPVGIAAASCADSHTSRSRGMSREAARPLRLPGRFRRTATVTTPTMAMAASKQAKKNGSTLTWTGGICFCVALG